jgi:hypothetical protein
MPIGEQLALVAEEQQEVERIGQAAPRSSAPRRGPELVARKVSSSVSGCSARWPRWPLAHHMAAITAPMPRPASRLSKLRKLGLSTAQAISPAAEQQAPAPGRRRPAPTPDSEASPVRQRSGARRTPRDPVHGGHAQHRGDALERREGRETQHDEYHQGLQVAATEAHEVFAAAAEASTHAEDRTARRRARPKPDPGLPLYSVLRVDQAAVASAQKRSSRRRRPAPIGAARVVAHGDGVGRARHRCRSGCAARSRRTGTKGRRPRGEPWRPGRRPQA